MDNNNGINAMFMQNVLRKNKEYDRIVVKRVRVEHACEKGENFASIVLRVHVEGYKTNSNIKFNIPLIVKRPFQSDSHAMFHSDDMFNNEALAYNQILPSLQQYLKSTLPTPVCLHANKSWIVLEDLNISGYRMNGNQICMTIDQCSVVLRELAVFHSASVILKTKHPRQVKVLANKIIDTYRSDNHAIADLVDTNIAIALQLLRPIKQQTEDIIHVIEILESHGKNHKIFKRVSELIKTKSDKNVFNHGDCWRNNMLFREQQNGDMEIKLIDLQVMRYTSVAADLCYFLFINLLPEDRVENREYLLNLYLNTFHNSLANHGINADELGYTRDWLDEEFNKFSIFGFMCSLLLAPVFYYDKNNIPDLKPNEITSDFHENFILQNMTPELKSRIIAIAVDFAKNCYFVDEN